MFPFSICPDTNLQTDSAKDIPSFRPSPQFWLNSEVIDGDNSALLHLAANNFHIGTLWGYFSGKVLQSIKTIILFLHCAAGGGYTELVKLLLDKGAPLLEARNIDGYTPPLHLAANNSYPGATTVETAG